MLVLAKGELYERDGVYWLKVGPSFSVEVLKCTPAYGPGDYLLCLAFDKDITVLAFASLEEYRFFERLRNVKGVGNTKASRLLSLFGTDALIRMLSSGDVEQLAQLPGIGIKTAKRLVAELSDTMISEVHEQDRPIREVLEALKDLGYDVRTASEVLNKDDYWRSLTLEEALRWVITALNGPRVGDV